MRRRKTIRKMEWPKSKLYWQHDEPTYEPNAIDYSDSGRYRKEREKEGRHKP